MKMKCYVLLYILTTFEQGRHYSIAHYNIVINVIYKVSFIFHIYKHYDNEFIFNLKPPLRLAPLLAPTAFRFVHIFGKDVSARSGAKRRAR